MGSRAKTAALCALVGSLTLACSTSARDDGSEDGGPLGGGEATGADDGLSGAGDGQPKLDTPDGATGGAEDGGSVDGCQKVDFLFVIDNSGSMGDEQQNLANSFPGFIATIEGTLEANDYHIMVVDTDSIGVEICSQLCMFLPDCNGVPCADIPPPDVCDTTIGAGKTNDLNGAACPIGGDQRYLVDGQADLNATFSCVAQVGTFGNGDEQQMSATMDAVSAALNGPGGCNEGFLRDDAILVVTVITDEEDGPAGPDAASETPSPGEPPDWKAALIAAKGGKESAVVVLGLVGDTDLPAAVCAPLDADFGSGAEPAPRLRTFVESFANHVLGSVCEPDYAPFFESAVSVIDTACDDFVPPG